MANRVRIKARGLAALRNISVRQSTGKRASAGSRRSRKA